MSSDKKIDFYFSKSTANQEDDDDDSDIEFLAEYKDLSKLEKKLTINDIDTDSTSTATTAIHEFTYTQENDSSLDFSTDEEQDFWKKVDSASSVFNSTTKLDKKIPDSNSEDEEEDEDIKLIFDSKELLDRIDGKLKSMIDLTSEKEGVSIKEKILKSEKSMDVSPIVCRNSSVEQPDSDEDYTPIPIYATTTTTSDEVKPSTSKDSSMELIHIDNFVFNQDCTMRDSDVSSDEGDLLLVQMADKCQANYEHNKSLSKSPAEAKKLQSPKELATSDSSELPEIFPNLSVQKQPLKSYQVELSKSPFKTPVKEDAAQDQFTSESDISKLSEVYINFSSKKKTPLTARLQSPVADKKNVPPMHSSSSTHASHPSDPPVARLVQEKIDPCKESQKISPKVDASLKDKVLSASAQSTHRLKRLYLCVSQETDEDASDERKTESKKPAKTLELLEESSSSSESSEDAISFSVLKQKYNLGAKTSTKPPPVTKESLYSPRTVVAATAAEASAKPPLSDVVKRIGTENIRTTKMMAPPVTDKRSKNHEIVRETMKDSESIIAPEKQEQKLKLLDNLPKRSVDTKTPDNGIKNPAAKRLKMTSPVKFSLLYKNAVQLSAEKKASEKPKHGHEIELEQPGAAVKLNSIDMQKRLMLQKLGGKGHYEKRTNSKAMEDLKKYNAREISKVGLGKIKTRKMQSTGEMNLTQMTNMAKRENEARIKAALTASEAQKKQAPPPAHDTHNVPQQNIQNEAPAAEHYVNPYVRKPLPTTSTEESYVNPFVRKPLSTTSTEEPYVNPFIRKPSSLVEESSLIQKHVRPPQVPSTTRTPLDPLITARNVPETASKQKTIAKPGSDFLGNIMNDMSKQQKDMQVVNSNINKENKRTDPEKYHINRFFYRLLKCSYLWLIEQNTQNFNTPPPILEPGELNPLVEAYYSYEEYYNAMFSLLLLELWEEISRAFRELKLNPASSNEKTKNNTNPIWIKQIEKAAAENLTTFTCQGVYENYGCKLPQDEDLYRVSLNLHDKTKNPKKIDYFAIIKHAYKLKNESEYMKEAVEFMKGLNADSKDVKAQKTTYSSASPAKDIQKVKSNEANSNGQRFSVYEIVFLIKGRPYAKENYKTVLDCELLVNLTSSLRRIKALIHFQNSPVLNALIEPNAQNPIFWPVPESNLNTKLIPPYCNETQRKVVVEASSIINTRDAKFVFVQGPPGTGKTRTIINIVKMIFNRVEVNLQAEIKNKDPKLNPAITKPGKVEIQNSTKTRAKFLICSPSNSNCDEILRRAVKEFGSTQLTRLNNTRSYCKILRFGYKEACSRSNENFEVNSFEILFRKKLDDLLVRKQSQNSKSIQEHVKNIDEREMSYRKKIEIVKSEKAADAAKQQTQLKDLEEDLSQLITNRDTLRRKLAINNPVSRADRKKLETEARDYVLKDADIIICTLNSCGRRELDCLTPERNNGNSLITTLIVDEAAQCIEVDFLIPMKFGCTKVILVGDPEQLPATVTSKKAEDMYLFQSFFERIYQRFRHQESCNPIRMLSIQYRMHPEICRFPSQNFYRNKLITDKKLAEKRLQESPLEPYLIFDITDSKEVCDNVGDSTHNPTEATCVVDFCGFLLKNFKYEIGIITPYKKQMECLKRLIRQQNFSQVEVGTVDSFQGREKDIILLSSVRANSEGKIGFLQQRQRLNVSITRAKHALYIFCHMESLKSNKDWRNLLEDGQNRKLVHTITSKTRPGEVFKKLKSKSVDSSCVLQQQSNSGQK